MGVDIPDSYDIEATILSMPPIAVSGVGPVGPVTVSGIPDTYHIHVEKLPKIQLGTDPVRIEPLDVSLRLKEIPSVRTHLPADFSAGVSLFGLELLCVRLCGEAQVITEPYRPNPCERCGHLPGHGVTLPPGSGHIGVTHPAATDLGPTEG